MARLALIWVVFLGHGAAIALPAWTRGDPTEELGARAARAQAMMKERGLDALFLTTEANVRYFTGYHSPFWLSPTRPWFAILPASGRPIAIVPTIGEDSFARAYTDKVITWPSPRAEDDGVSSLLTVFAEMPKSSGKIGAELGSEMTVRMSLLDFDRMRKELSSSGRSIVDGGDVIKHTRLIKSELEVAKVEAACKAMTAAYSEVPSKVLEGMTEVEACKVVKRLFLEHGADDVPYNICTVGKGSYKDIIGHPTERRLQYGDMMIIDAGAQVDGYYCDHNRNFAIGPPRKEAKDAYDLVYKATDAGLNTVRPGASFQDIYRSMAKVLGMEDISGGVGRMGHSVGLQLTEWPSIHPAEKTLLEEGMVLSIEPSVELASGGGHFVVTEEEVVVVKGGYRLLSERAPKNIPSIVAASKEL